MNPYSQYMYSYPHKTAYRPLQGVFLKDYADRLAGPMHSLYLHVPFCQSKCGYCNLFSVTGQTEDAMDRYLHAVNRQITQYQEILAPARTEFSDFTIGGGTPLLLSEQQLDQVFAMINRHLSFSRNRQMIIETAPNQTSAEKLQILKEAGVTRVSMGIQSFHDSELHALRRQHGADQAKRALELLMSFDFPQVNIDFIYGIPGQTIASLLDSLKTALAFGTEELFLYPLYVKHGAGLEQIQKKEGTVLRPELALSQYQEAAAFLRANGFRQDSMRRFVRIRNSKDNRMYEGGRPDRSIGYPAADRRAFSDCGFGTSLALGCGGRSYLGNLHFCTPYAITQKDCLNQLSQFERTADFGVISHGILLSEEEIKRRYVIRHLLIMPGLERKRYQEQFQSDVMTDFPLLEDWLRRGWVSKGEDILWLTDTGLSLSDWIGPQLISPDIRQRMNEWEALHDSIN